MEKGLVSIISPCYNREKILWRFLDSVLSQTYKKLQLILIDDGSTDNTLSVMQDYIEKFEGTGIRYEYYSKPNGGVSSAINEGLKYVKGEFLCWPDSDDWYEPDSIEKRVDFLNTHPELDSSLSHSNTTYEAELSYRDAIELLTTETLNMISMSDIERRKYVNYCHIKNARRRLLLAVKYGDEKIAKAQIKELYLYKKLRIKDLLNYVKVFMKNNRGGVKLPFRINVNTNIKIFERGGVLYA